jgi:hypothetical protein
MTPFVFSMMRARKQDMSSVSYNPSQIYFFCPGVSGMSHIDLSRGFEGEGSRSLALLESPPLFLGDASPRLGFGAKGIVEVGVNTGSRSGRLTDAGVEGFLLNGSILRGTFRLVGNK